MTLGNGIGFAETSIRICHCTLSKISKQSRSHLRCGGILKSRINATSFSAGVFIGRGNIKYILIRTVNVSTTVFSRVCTLVPDKDPLGLKYVPVIRERTVFTIQNTCSGCIDLVY
jgi:hypothetical protein